jgi:hypothetical protein
MAKRVYYVSYFRYENAEVQKINGIYSSKEYKEKWGKDKIDFFSYGPDDVSAMHLFKLTRDRFNELLPLIDLINASELEGSDCEDLLSKVSETETIASVWGGWVAEDEDGNSLSIGDKVSLVEESEDNVYVITKFDGEKEIIYIEDEDKNEYFISPEYTILIEEEE